MRAMAHEFFANNPYVSYAVLSLAIFFAVFVYVLGWVFLKSSSQFQSVADLPLEKDHPHD